MNNAKPQIDHAQDYSITTQPSAGGSNKIPPVDQSSVALLFPGEDDPRDFPQWAYARRAWHQIQISLKGNAMKTQKTQTQTRFETAVEKTAEIRFAINNGGQSPELFRDWRHSLECLPVFDEDLYGRIRSLASEAWDTVCEKDIQLVWKCLQNHHSLAF